MESPTRILVIVKHKHLDGWKQAWDEPQKIITCVLKKLHYDHLISLDDTYDSSDCRFIAVERWDPLVFLVFDLFNVEYNHLDAHLAGKN
ncbi:hypothetical protein B0I35DRAFT_423808 [Stachybotrys elegans]|uniref:Uncharacterized protein n=1 Tax=Stachybotrys elegans TaxID=80388 RepID=A0A8K0WTL1_9HYPO|nr:hypothetical protein B0I35DRAFT_423808 [Stachybotrys elegans]